MQKNPKLKEKGTVSKELRFFDAADILLDNLPERSREIIKKRFGLMSGRIETLENIGRDYGITRERVRQIIHDAFNKIKGFSGMESFKGAEEKIILEISRSSGIISEEDLIGRLGGGDPMESSAIAFFAVCSKKLVELEEKGLVKKSWAVSGNILEDVKKTYKVAEEILAESMVPLSGSGLVGKIVAKEGSIPKNDIINFLNVLEGISKNKFGKWGFSDWMEINPKGTRERIYLVLKEVGKPLHFREIAKLIDKAGINKKKSHPQTVHNELIKDKRFVLIGRGVYALMEWGYAPGTISDVLEDILKKNDKPMKKEEILEAVLKIREVKKATIMINLNNKNKFMKQGEGYVLKR